jgi:O-antigen ligase
VLLGAVALLQFIWAMGSVYIFKKDIADPGVYLFINRSNVISLNKDITWRYGIFRTSSLTYHAYILGLFNLLILTIYSYTQKRMNIPIITVLVSGIIASVSRMAYAGLAYVISVHSLKKKWLIPVLLIFVLVAALSLFRNDDIRLQIKNLSSETKIEDIGPEKIRAYTRYKALEIWKDHPIWGAGPGMFGGIIASKYRSYIYEEYNVSLSNYIHGVGGIEQFWFQILAELGVVGALFFINLIMALFITLYRLRKQAKSMEMKNLFSALMVFIVCIMIYTLGSGINIAPILFTYCAFVGIGLGSISNQSEDKSRGIKIGIEKS